MCECVCVFVFVVLQVREVPLYITSPVHERQGEISHDSHINTKQEHGGGASYHVISHVT